MDSARVEFLVQPDAWTAWAALYPEQATRDALLTAAFAEYADARLVAAWVLEAVCLAARRQAAEAALVAGQQTKSYEVVGDWKEEYFAPTQLPDTVDADAWCARAAALRGEVRQMQQRRRTLGSVGVPVVVS